MQEKFKKKWKKPGLIILVRERPEEAVLQLCKCDFINRTGPNYYDCANFS